MRILLAIILFVSSESGSSADPLHFPVKRHRNPQNLIREPEYRPPSAQYLNNQTAPFSVNGTSIPLYPGDIGESYAGLLPIAQAYRVDPHGTDPRSLFSCFFPSTSTNHPTSVPENDSPITIWLTGGPGCSSLIAVLQENGPLRWEPGTPAPTANPWSWNRLTDIVYVEFPVGVGFTQGEAGLLKNEEEAARELLGFWKGFVGLFGLRGKRILIAGESYGGYYVPDIAKAMLDEEDPEFFNVDGAFMIDSLISNMNVAQQIPHRAMTLNFPHLFPFNTSFESELIALDERCGFTVFLNEFLVFPPRGIQPSPPTTANGCSIFETLTSALSYINPCFSTYQITATCPFPADPILNPPDGIEYFNRSDVQAAINAPRMDWEVCRLGVFDDNLDGSAPPNIEVLPHVIERLNKTLIVSGQLDLILPTNGTLLAIQNMTCNGALGFTSPPTQNQFFVPYAAIATTGPEGGFSATGVMGTTHAERGLTVFLAGHQIPHSSCHHPKHKTRRSTHKAERRGHKEPKVLKLVTRALKCAGRWLVNKNFTSTQ